MSEAELSVRDPIRACLLGALRGDAAIAEDLLVTAECMAQTGGLDEGALRQAGLSTPPSAGGIVVRTLPYALLTPLDRPRLRRGSYRCAAVAGLDEGACIAAVAATVLAADLVRGFDLSTALMRCHQTLLEEAPSALLTRLQPLGDDAALSGDSDPTIVLQLAITALHRATGVDSVVEAFATGEDRSVAGLTLATALAGVSAGFEGFDAAQLDEHPLRERAESAAAALAEAAARRGEPAGSVT